MPMVRVTSHQCSKPTTLGYVSVTLSILQWCPYVPGLGSGSYTILKNLDFQCHHCRKSTGTYKKKHCSEVSIILNNRKTIAGTLSGVLHNFGDSASQVHLCSYICIESASHVKFAFKYPYIQHPRFRFAYKHN